VAVKGGLFKTKAKKAEVEKENSALDKHFNRANSEYEEKALEEPHHSENCDNVSSLTDDVMPDSQRGRLSTRSEVSHFESVVSECLTYKQVRRLLHLTSLTSTKIQTLPEPLGGQTTQSLGQLS